MRITEGGRQKRLGGKIDCWPTFGKPEEGLVGRIAWSGLILGVSLEPQEKTEECWTF